MLKVGIIGLNNIGKLHAAAYQSAPQAELVCICDMMKERAEEAARTYGVKAYSTIEEMLRNESLDAVSVATGGVENGSMHYEPTLQCLEAGLHVLVEKPISNDIEQGRAMVRVARERNRYLGVNLNHRFVPPAIKAKGWMEEGRLGEALLVNMTLWIDNPNESSPWFHLRALHPHSIDVMRYFCGPIRRVQAFGTHPSSRQTWSTVSVNMQFENGAVGHLTGSYDASMNHPIERCEVLGSEGRFVLENVYESLTYYPRRSSERTVLTNSIFSGVGSFNDSFRYRIHRWVEQVDAGVPGEEIEGSGEEGLAVQEVIEAAIRSIQGGTVETLSDAQSYGTGND